MAAARASGQRLKMRDLRLEKFETLTSNRLTPEGRRQTLELVERTGEFKDSAHWIRESYSCGSP